MSLPSFQSLVAQNVNMGNFIAIQSAQLAVTNSSSSITFTLIPGTIRRTFKITNSGSKGCYLASGAGSATAVVSSSTPIPVSSVANAVATCDYIGAGETLIMDYLQGTTTLAAITAGSDSTTLEISSGYGS